MLEDSKFYTEDKSLKLSETALSYIKEIAKWAKFFAIIGYIGIAFFIVMAAAIGVFLPSLNSNISNTPFPVNNIGIAAFYVLIAAFYIYPVITLHGFANKTNEALNNHDDTILEEAFKKLKSHFKFVGKLTIIMLVIYVLFLFVIMIGGFIGGFLGAL